MNIIEKVFRYEETDLPIIKYKDEIWFKGKTVTEIAIMLNLKTKENCQNWSLNPNRTKRTL